MADFCVYWFRRAQDTLPDGGRAGLVATNTIRQNETRGASLDYVLDHGGTITEAVSTQVWSGEAAVHVSIVNWIKGDELGLKKLFTQKGDDTEGHWIVAEVESINSSLSFGTDVAAAAQLQANQKPKRCFRDRIPYTMAFSYRWRKRPNCSSKTRNSAK